MTESRFTGKVILDMSMSLDGFTAGPDIGLDQPLGREGERLHVWMSEPRTEREDAVDMFKLTGAVITGRRTFDVGIDLWGDEGAFGMPCFVLTHRPRETLVKGPTTFTFVTEGIESALEQARAAAGEKNIWLMGAASVADQYLKAGLVDEIYVHLVPLLVGAGARIFDQIGALSIDLDIMQIIPAPKVTHLLYRVVKA